MKLSYYERTPILKDALSSIPIDNIWKNQKFAFVGIIIRKSSPFMDDIVTHLKFFRRYTYVGIASPEDLSLQRDTHMLFLYHGNLNSSKHSL